MTGRSAVLLLSLLACVPPPEPPTGVVIYADRSPPRLLDEEVGAPPGSGLIWRRGYWRWTGNEYQWSPGHWVTIPAGSRAWVPGQWVRTRKGWFFVEGHWK